MAELNTSKPIVLNGVGVAYINRVVDGKKQSIKLGTLQDMKLSFSASDDKVYGGDGTTPIYIITKDQSVNVSFTEAEFSLEYLAVTNGAEMASKGRAVKSIDGVLIASGTSYQVEGGMTTIIPEETICNITDDALGHENVQTLKYVSGSPSTGEFTIDKNGAVTLGDAVTNKYISLSLVYEVDGRSATITTASAPQFVEIRHESHPVDMGNGTHVKLHTIIYKARATGKLDIDHKRQAASAPELAFEVMYDTSRTDGATMMITAENL